MKRIAATVLCMIGAFSAGCQPAAKVTIRVADDAGNPLADSSVRVSFEQLNNPNRKTVVAGATDSAGLFTATSRTSGFVLILAEKAGYYESRAKWQPAGGEESGRYLPWNPTIGITMRQIVNPTPLLLKSVELRGVSNVAKASFDVVVGDWVQPHGRGIIGDLLFEWEGNWRGVDDREAMLTLRFANAGDGILERQLTPLIEGEFRLPHEAPMEGYRDQKIWREIFKNPTAVKSRIEQSDLRSDIGYFFRVRSRQGGNDNERGQLYGKMEGDVTFFGAGKRGSGLRFKYYLNPTPNDRNLEYDGTNNLFEVRQPAGR